MNTKTPLWPLVRNELGIDHYSKFALAIGVAYVSVCWWAVAWVPLGLLIDAGYSRGNIATLFGVYGGAFTWMMFGWLTVAGFFFGQLLIPRKSGGVSNVWAFEFLFTRAIDRGQLLRAKVAVIYLTLLTPLLIDFLACLVLQNGAAAYIGWLICGGTFLLLLTQACYAVVAKHLKGRIWLMYFILGAPMLADISRALCFPDLTFSFYNRSFLLFSAHPLLAVIALAVLAPIVQNFSAQRFAEFEVP